VLDVVAPDQNQLPAAIYRRTINDREPRLASADGTAGEPLAAKPANEPQGQCEEAEHHNKGEQHLEGILSLAEQGIEHYSSPLR
jgi:hypothetical protein